MGGLFRRSAQLTRWIEDRPFQRILDTGADSTIIAKSYCPKNWPLSDSPANLQRIGTASFKRSSKWLDWRDEEGHGGICQPFVLENIPVNLWGKDVLQGMGAVLTTQPAEKMMHKMGWCPRAGLRKKEPLSEFSLPTRHGENGSGLGN